MEALRQHHGLGGAGGGMPHPDSEDEVLLSDPSSEDEDSHTENDYDYADDQHGEAAYGAAPGGGEEDDDEYHDPRDDVSSIASDNVHDPAHAALLAELHNGASGTGGRGSPRLFRARSRSPASRSPARRRGPSPHRGGSPLRPPASPKPAPPLAVGLADTGLPEDTVKALAALNWMVNRKPTADLSLMDSCTEANLRRRVEELVAPRMAGGQVGPDDERSLDNLAEALLPAVRLRQQQLQGRQQASGGASTSEGAGDSAAANGPASPINVNAIIQRVVSRLEEGGEQQQQQQQQQPAAAAGRGLAAITSDPSPAPALASPSRASYAAAAATAAAAPPVSPGSSGPASGSAAGGASGPKPGGLPALPARPARPAAGSAMPSLPARGGGSAMPSLPARGGGGGSSMPSLPARPARPATASAAPSASETSGPAKSTAGASMSSGTTPAPAANGAAASSAAASSAGASARGAGAGGAAPTANGTGGAGGGGGGAGGGAGSQAGANGEVVMPEDDGEDQATRDLRKKVQDMRVMLVRVARRLGHNARSNIVQQVLYRLDLAERIRAPQRAQRRVSPFEAAVDEAQRLEAADGGAGPLPFTATILCLGLTGVGKSATINSLLGVEASETDAFEPATRRVRVVEGTVAGMRLRFIDTPGLQPSAGLVGRNQAMLRAAKRARDKYKPDIVMYFDRMDLVRREGSDLPLLRAVTSTLGPAMWFNALVVLTHAAAAPPDGNAGPITSEQFANHRSHLLQQAIRAASGDMRLLNPVAMVENHPACRRNAEGQPLLPSGVAWRQHLLLLSLSSKLLQDADSVLKMQDGNAKQQRALQMALFRGQKIPPIPYLLSQMTQPHAVRKLPEDERSMPHDDQLAAMDEQARREAVRKRREFIKAKAAEAAEEKAGGGNVAVPAPDPALPPSFEADGAPHRYRFMEGAGGWLTRPFVEPHGVDHDDGIDGFSVEKGTVLRKPGQYLFGVPMFASAQVHKDKNQFSLQSEVEGSYHHSSKWVSTGGIDLQTVGPDLLYTSHLESRLRTLPRNKTAAGLTVSRLTEGGGLPTSGPVALGVKIEDRLKITPKAKLVAAAGVMTTKTRVGRESAAAGNAELRVRAGADETTQVVVGASAMSFRKDLAIGGNVSAQFMATPGTTLASRLNLNSKGTGQVTLRTTSHDHPQLAAALLVPVFSALLRRLRGRSDELV